MKHKVIVQVDWPKDVFLKLSDIAEVKFVTSKIKEELIRELKDADALVAGVTPINKELLDNTPRLRIIARFGVGYDNVDVEECTKRGIYVTYTPNALSDAVADLTLGLIICLARRIVQADRYVRTTWGKPESPAFPLGVDLSGKKLGIVGLGRIGSAVARKAKVFDMEIIYFDTARKVYLEENLGIRYVDLKTLLRDSDFVTIHVPLSESTRGLIGEKELRIMKKSAYIINTSRGPVIDEDTLYTALKEGWIAGAALDVFREEPLPLNSPLRKLENIVLTPHIGSASKETRRRMAEMDVRNIRSVLEGKVPPNPVPEQKGLVF